jgi:predicted RNA-binding Zn-ribbon protein involved in translation (DUF1610 family)
VALFAPIEKDLLRRLFGDENHSTGDVVGLLAEKVLALQKHRQMILDVWRASDESMLDAEVVLVRAFCEASGGDEGRFQSFQRHPEKFGLENDLDAYLQLATDATLSLLSKAILFLETALLSYNVVASGAEVGEDDAPPEQQRPDVFWPRFVKWLRDPRTVREKKPPSELPVCAEAVVVKVPCPKCGEPATRESCKERSADEGWSHYLFCDSCGYGGRI